MTTFKHLMIFFTLCLFLGSFARAQEQCLLNPSFEDPDDTAEWHSDLAAHWDRWGHWMNRETAWTPKRDGDCMMGYHHWDITEPDTSGIYQDVRGVPSGSLCVFRVDAWKDELTNIKSLELRLEPFDGGVTIASKRYSMMDLSTEVWERIEVFGSNQGEGIRVLIILEPSGDHNRNGALKFDLAELEVTE